jgi:2-phosphosulfolactate phosphatase
VRFDWGPAAAGALAPSSACLVIVDVLSFTTSVTVAGKRHDVDLLDAGIG